MKSNAHLYLPWSAVIELVYVPRVQLHQSMVPMASVELDGGCRGGAQTHDRAPPARLTREHNDR